VIALRDPVVCVVGAGPAGLVVSHLLQRADIPFVVFERRRPEELRRQMKAGMVEQRTVDLLRPYGLQEPIVERGSRVGVCEFRVDGEAFVLEYGALCDGRGHYIYPQQQLVDDWIDQLLDAGGDVRFGAEVSGIQQLDGGVALDVVTDAAVAPTPIECAAVACCDGAASRFNVGLEAAAFSYPFRWLTLIASVPPLADGTIYALHHRGFAGQMHRSPTVTRFMLEVGSDDRPEDWPEDRIWAELEARLAARGRPALRPGALLERDVLDHRVRVCEPMQQGHLFLAGDAAHLITPAGGKGMNIAVQDAVELGEALCECYGRRRDRQRLEAYSRTRLPEIWRHQEFSNLMLSLFHSGSSTDPAAARFSHGLRRARMHQVLHDPDYARWFAHSYVGIDRPV
jgi:p-hydroxybenzoate 3-monooxygenase